MDRATDLPTEQRKRVLLALGYYDYQLSEGIWEFSKEAGWILETSMAHYGALPDYWDGDGIITILYPDRRDLIDYIQSRDARVVNLTADVDLGYSQVLLDNERIGRLAAEHLLSRGFNDLAYLKITDATDIIGRMEGFRRKVVAADKNFILLDWAKASKKRKGTWYDWLAEELPKLPTPIGIMAQSDTRANHLICACESIGLRIPEQVAIVGVDNKEMVCRSAPIPISSVDSDRHRLAYEGAALLDRLMHGEPAPDKPIIIPPKEVVVRQSSNILAIDHVQVAAALKYIWENFTDPINVDDVLRVVNMSRCGIYRAFEKYVGRSIGEEIARKRIDEARKLLRHTNHKLHEIAEMSGFSGGEHFSRAFTRLVGLNPSTYRARHRRDA